MPFLKIIDVSDVSLFLMFLAACRIAGAIVWSKLCKEQILSFLFREQCPLKPTLALAIQNSNTRPVASLMFPISRRTWPKKLGLWLYRRRHNLRQNEFEFPASQR